MMTLNEALALVRASKQQLDSRKAHFLACGFEPLHLASLLEAHLHRSLGTGVELLRGVYGDLPGNLEAAARSNAIAAAVVLEWADLDPRLGLRSSGGWTLAAQRDILSSLPDRLGRIERSLAALGSRMPVALTRPSLPLPPLQGTPAAQTSAFALDLEQQLAAFLARCARLPGIRLASALSDPDPLDPATELLAGFPYRIPYASRLAALLTALLYPAPPLKGLITDLDDTLWSGLIGETGPEGVSWSQESHTQIHGLYQQLLGRLADQGVLLAVASKNEQAAAEAGLARPDLLAPAAAFYPVIATWGPKSVSVARILEAWNIGADAVAFVDDSALEIAEVQQAFPAMQCFAFPGKSPARAWPLIQELAARFGKPHSSDEDSLRAASIRASAEVRALASAAEGTDFLSALDGEVSINWRPDSSQGGRALELINKTNQFNLNGRRLGEGEWRRWAEADGCVFAEVSYRDKFGALGRIAALLGRLDPSGNRLRLSFWVMSCRAFSRRIEHHTLDALFERFAVDAIELDFEPTARNQPLVAFLATWEIASQAGVAVLTRAAFLAHRGPLPHALKAQLGETA